MPTASTAATASTSASIRRTRRRLQRVAVRRHEPTQNLRTGARAASSRAPKGEQPLRFNWNTPILLSPHARTRSTPAASSCIVRATAATLETISPDLTSNDAEKLAGNVPHCTITTIAESPLARAGCGSAPTTAASGPAGRLLRDWTNLTGASPACRRTLGQPRRAARRTCASAPTSPSRATARTTSKPLLFRTVELARARVEHRRRGCPRDEPINVVREDPRNPDVLYVGTEFGVHASWDAGETWQRLGRDLPTLAVHDLALHDTTGVLVAATHGRGMWALDVNATRGDGREGREG
jgi:hypothetical protein